MTQEYLAFTTSDRGLRYMPPLPLVNGGQIRVYESSNAASPCVWVNVSEPAYHEPRAADVNTAVQLHVDDALALAHQLYRLVGEHYQTNADR